MKQDVINGLIDRGLPRHVALGFGGNMAVESGFQPGINEINPIVPGSRGGYGLNQWTGPRRRQFESFAQEQGKPLDDLDVQLDFTLWELANTETSAREKIMATSTPTEAATAISNYFLRPGIPHMDRRIEETNRLAGMSFEQPEQNALARYVPPPQLGGFLDVRDFLT